MIEYKLNTKDIQDENNKMRIAYGIEVYKNSTPVSIIDDISDDKIAIEKLIRNFNEYELDIEHLERAIEDFLINLSTD